MAWSSYTTSSRRSPSTLATGRVRVLVVADLLSQRAERSGGAHDDASCLACVLDGPGRAGRGVLYGVNDPDPDLDYYGIEIPLTRPLAPTEHLAVDATLVPLVPRHHYEAMQTPVALPDELDVICKAAYGDTPSE